MSTPEEDAAIERFECSHRAMMADSFKRVIVLRFTPKRDRGSGDVPQEAIEAAAAAMWNHAAPVQFKQRPTWEEIALDPEWRRPVEATRNEARVALEAAASYKERKA